MSFEGSVLNSSIITVSPQYVTSSSANLILNSFGAIYTDLSFYLEHLGEVHLKFFFSRYFLRNKIEI